MQIGVELVMSIMTDPENTESLKWERNMSINEALATLAVVIMFFSIFGLIAYNVYKSPDDRRYND